MAKAGKIQQKKMIKNVINIDYDEQTVQGVADAFLIAVDDIDPAFRTKLFLKPPV